MLEALYYVIGTAAPPHPPVARSTSCKIHGGRAGSPPIPVHVAVVMVLTYWRQPKLINEELNS